MGNQRGRPPKSVVSLSRDTVVAAALRLVDEHAGERFSLRSLASILDVTPMALYSHIGDLDGLLRAMAERCFTVENSQKFECGEQGLERHLLWYCERVLRYPGLTATIVARQGELPAPQQVWTDSLTRFILDRGWNILWKDILVDHLHGFALACAAAAMEREKALTAYAAKLELLLGSVAISGN